MQQGSGAAEAERGVKGAEAASLLKKQNGEVTATEEWPAIIATPVTAGARFRQGGKRRERMGASAGRDKMGSERDGLGWGLERGGTGWGQREEQGVGADLARFG